MDLQSILQRNFLYIGRGGKYSIYYTPTIPTIQPQTHNTATNPQYSHKLLYIVYKGRGGLIKYTVKFYCKKYCKFTEISL